MDKQIEEMAKKYPITDKDKLFNVVNSACDLVYMRKDNIEKIVNALYNEGYRKIPKNAVVLTREEYNELQKGVKTHNYTAMFEAQDAYRWEQGYFQGCKETAEKFARLVEFHSVSTRDNDGREIFTISALGLKEILHEEFGIPYDEICKEFTER